jgi:hypothetical protein
MKLTYEERVYLWQGVLYNQEDVRKGLDNPYLEDDVRNGLLKKLAILEELEDKLIFQWSNHGQIEAVTN